ncbi:hypothetical protein, partial [Acinetobacter indicus]|uniref:hypothetical protein n=1 Tax=Acinetobacter indicus TaxID=756892 RepID=UPI003988D233
FSVDSVHLPLCLNHFRSSHILSYMLNGSVTFSFVLHVLAVLTTHSAILNMLTSSDAFSL